MLKFFKVFVIVIIVLAALVYFSSGYLFKVGVQKVLPYVFERLADRGINVVDYQFDSIRFSSFRTVSANNIRAHVSLSRADANEQYTADIFARRLNVHLVELLNPAATLSCENFQFQVEKAAEIPGTSFGRFDRGTIRFHDLIYLSNPRAGVLKIMQEVSGLFREEDVFPNADLRALVTFNVKGKKAQAVLYTIRAGDESKLRFEENDIRKMADVFDLDLSDDEVKIISAYPMRAPVIMRITSDAKEISKNAHKQNRSVPEDAYRHILWSYLLTQKFGETFAEMVTDAHEVLPTNTAAERKMDFHNNQLGRQYAAQGTKQDRILWLVNNDRKVIKYPEDVDSR